MDKQDSNRMVEIDILKALGMICIVLGHVLKTGTVRQFLYSFSVPFFFFLIGVTYKHKSDIKLFYVEKVRRILIPYFSFAIVSILIFNVLGEFASSVSDSFATTDILPNLVGALFGNSRTGYMKWNIPLWFLTCLFACYFLVDSFERLVICRQKQELVPWGRSVFILSGIVISNILSSEFFDIMLPLQFETAFLMASFAELGILFKNSVLFSSLKNKKNKVYVFVIIVAFLIGAVISLLNGEANAQTQSFGKSMCLYIASSVLWGAGLFALSVMMSKSIKLSSFFSYIGRHTMGILLMHKFPVLLFQTVVPYSNTLLVNKSNTSWGIVWAILVTIIVMAMCLLVEKVINPILPWVFGNRRERKQ